MPVYKIRGIDVDFPFEAYDCQIVYMEKVIRALQERCNALLESPTGTGKTLCLLCATLAWRKNLGGFSTGSAEEKGRNFGSRTFDTSEEGCTRRNLPTIIYTSRTHSQLQQVIKELKTCRYRPKMVILGSREQMCIHKEVQVLRGSAQNNACHQLCRKRSCFHHIRVSDYIKNNPDLGNEPLDIEDLVNIGRSQGPCPYYVSRELHKLVDILFAPYNYLIDPGNRRSLSGIQWDNTVLIFDEAHNLESLCADAASFDLHSSHLAACISEAKQCVDLSLRRRAIDQSDDKSLNPDNFAILRALLLKLENRIAEVPIESKELGFTKSGTYIYELLAELKITHETANMLIETIGQASLLLEDDAGNKPNQTKGTVCRLESLRDILKIIFKDGDRSHANFYRVHIQESQGNPTGGFKDKASRTLSWWCFNPGIAMEEFTKLGVRSIILTSGTLSPLDSFAMELKLDFPLRLENPHVIESNQVWVGVVPTGPSGCSFNSSFRNRDSVDYKRELGNAIVNFARIIPDGLLVFFPSYYLLDKCVDSWKNMGNAGPTIPITIWERICKHKQPVIEPKNSSLFSYSIEDFNTKLNDKSASGAIFFAVCRGKVSEGLDFADHSGRAVIITGMPFAMRTDPKIRLKREYLDQQAQSVKKEYMVLTGEEWYCQQAARAVNQAVGRVIRHRHDYGAIIFCDERFSHKSRQDQMSLWLRPHVKCYTKFGDAIFTLTKFFREKGTCSPMEPKLMEKLEMGSDSVSSLKPLLKEHVCEPSESEKPSRLDFTKLICENVDEVMIDQHPIRYPAKTSSCEAAMVKNSKISLSSLLAASRHDSSNYRGVLPANQAKLFSTGQKGHLMKKDCPDPTSKLPKFGTNEKDPVNIDCEVVDLTGGLPSHDSPKADAINSFKRPKTVKLDSNAFKYPKYYSADALCTGASTHCQRSTCPSFSVDKNCPLVPQTSLIVPEKNAISNNNENTQHAKTSSCLTSPVVNLAEDSKQVLTVPCGDVETRGSAFLNQVQELLTAEEYKEFVGFMKALKSKTMKIIPVLESIARLFSYPGRLVLLERFKDFVPAKYQVMYERVMKDHDAIVSS